MTEDEMVGWHHRLSGHEFAQTPGDVEGQGILACCSPWDSKELDTMEQLNSSNAGHSVARVHTCTHALTHNARAHTHTHTYLLVNFCKSSEFTSNCLGASRADFNCAFLSYTSS